VNDPDIQKLPAMRIASCLAAALFERYAVACGDEIVAEWRPVRGQ